MRSEGFYVNEKFTVAGIEPASFRFVAQHLNHCANASAVYVRFATKISAYFPHYYLFHIILNKKGKGKVIPLQAQCSPEGG